MKTKIGSTPVELNSLQGMPMAEIFELAGYDYNKFDSAIPQGLFDQLEKLGAREKFGFYYGDADSHMFGRLLGMGEVLTKLWAAGKLYVVEIDEKKVGK